MKTQIKNLMDYEIRYLVYSKLKKVKSIAHNLGSLYDNNSDAYGLLITYAYNLIKEYRLYDYSVYNIIDAYYYEDSKSTRKIKK